MKFSINEITNAVKPTEFKLSFKKLLIKSVETDTRKIGDLESDKKLFIAIIGKNYNAHNFIEKAIEKGVKNFVLSEKYNFKTEVNVWYVNNTVDALQALAIVHRNKFELPVIAITGSNGKTIVKEWLYFLLKDKYKIVRSPKSYNSQIGVPLSILKINEQHTLGIFEAGISQVGEMEKLERIIKPQVGILTNIGSAHDEGFESREQKLQEKLKLFVNSFGIITNEFLSKKLSQNVREYLGFIVVPSPKITISKNTNSTSFFLKQDNFKVKFNIPFTDEASIENAKICATYMAMSKKDFSDFEYLPKVSMRLELFDGPNNVKIINDTYNADLDSIRIALDFLVKNATKKRSLILSYLTNLENDVFLKKELKKLLLKTKLNKFITVGEEWKNIEADFKNLSKKYHNFSSKEELVKSFKLLNINNESILVKGERKYDLQKVSEQLTTKKHETVLEINLDAIVNNLNYYKSKLNKKTKILVMVKSFAYGIGAFDLAKLLEHQNIDYLAVAYLDEGIELRKAGIRLPIMVMNTNLYQFKNCISYNLEPVIFDVSSLQNWIISKEFNKDLPLHLKINTGMNRLGIDESEILELNSLIQSNSLNIKSVFSHLVEAENVKNKVFTLNQFASFDKVKQQLKPNLPQQTFFHILNSSGVLNYPKFQLDMVRLGYGVFGYANDKNLIHCLTFKTFISQLRIVEKGSTVGYGNNFVLKSKRVVATIGVGYADGIMRKAGNGNFAVSIKGKSYPTIGNICMDMCMIDLGENVDDITTNDEVIIFNAAHSIEILAQSCETISYEIMTNISQRVKRVYWQEELS